jgi:opacity protein-like surface antigen
MKDTFRPFALSFALGAVALCSTLTARSQSSQSASYPWYLKVDLGGTITQDADLKQFFGIPTEGSKVKFDPGIRVGLAGGYNFTDWFALEAEVGGLANTINSITGATFIHDAGFINVPFLVNVKLQLPNPSIFTPYIGAGGGGSAAIIDVDNIEIGNTTFHGSASDVVFAYQGFAGIRCRINDQMGLSVEYHYFVAESPSWKTDVLFAAPPFNNTLSFGRTQTHSLSLALDFRF